jgi:hypothetical protein
MRFFHLRPKLENGNYSRTGGLTIGYVKLDGEKKLVCTFARCSENDVWNRKKSVLICTGRFHKGKFIEVARPEKEDIYETLHKLAMQHDEKVKAARGQHG